MHTPARPTTTGLESGVPPPNRLSPIEYGYQNQAQVHWNAVNAVQQYGRPVSFEISMKKNETLKIFDWGAESFEMLHDRMVDQISRNNPMWRTILLWLGTAMRPVKKAECLTLECLSVNSWDLSVMLENFLILWSGDSLYKNRHCSCGLEPANGFELLRGLIADNRGGGVAVKMAGVKALNSFPHCTSVASLGQHLGVWEDLFIEFDAGLDSTPAQLVIVPKENLPASITTDLLDYEMSSPMRTL